MNKTTNNYKNEIKIMDSIDQNKTNSTNDQELNYKKKENVLNDSFDQFMKNENQFESIKSHLVSMNLIIETFTERYNDMGYTLENNKTVLLNDLRKKLSSFITVDKNNIYISFKPEFKKLVSSLNLCQTEIKWLCDLIISLNSKMETLNTISWNESLMCQFCHLVIGSPISPCGHHVCHTCYNIVPTREVRGEHCQRSFYKLNYGKFCPVCYEASELPTFLYVQNGQVTHQGVNMIPSINPYISSSSINPFNLIDEGVDEDLNNSTHESDNDEQELILFFSFFKM